MVKKPGHPQKFSPICLFLEGTFKIVIQCSLKILQPSYLLASSKDDRKVFDRISQSNQIRLAVGDGNFDPSRFAWLVDTLNNVRYKIQLKLTDA